SDRVARDQEDPRIVNVTPHLGWPAPPPTTAPGLGWPANGSFAPVEPQVFGSTPAPEPTPSLEPSVKPSVEPSVEPNVEPNDRLETTVDIDVSRETPQAAAPAAVTRAADLAAAEISLGGDGSTPLAKAAEHSLAVASRRPLGRRLPRPQHARVMVVANQ